MQELRYAWGETPEPDDVRTRLEETGAERSLADEEMGSAVARSALTRDAVIAVVVIR